MTTPSDTIFQTYNRHAELEGIAHRVDPTLSFEAQPLREALAVWRDAAKGRVLPCRVDMTPKAMKGFLRHIAIVDVVRETESTRYRLRISGTEIDATEPVSVTSAGRLALGRDQGHDDGVRKGDGDSTKGSGGKK